MPELPEVETTMRGISPHIVGKKIEKVAISQYQLRWPIPEALPQHLIAQTITETTRRAKYLLLHTRAGALMIHLGMSGSLRIVTDANQNPPRKHDHVIIQFANDCALHYHDPRRFGSMHWLSRDIDGKLEPHLLLDSLGPEPLSSSFSGEYLHQMAKGRKTKVKTFLMTNNVVVGVGNIYANEALFLSGIDPRRAAGNISRARYVLLADHIKQTLSQAIKQGGTTLRDFVNASGEPGYFAQSLRVYNRADLPCAVCSTPIKRIVIAQRASYFCPSCQK